MNISITIYPTPTPDLNQLINHMNQRSWIDFTAEWHLSSRIIAALNQEQQTLGFLRYVIQTIGPEVDEPPVIFNGRTLTEAKVLAFGVDPAHQQQGIGRRLQETLIDQARAHGCHQIRSHSSLYNKANHHLKLSLGFAIHPIPTDGNRHGFYFLLPL